MKLKSLLVLLPFFLSTANAKEIITEEGYQPWLASSGSLYFYSKSGTQMFYNKVICKATDASSIGLIKTVPVQSMGGKPVVDNTVIALMMKTPFGKPSADIAEAIPSLCAFGEFANQRTPKPAKQGEPI